jgi:hypothetical protein
MRLVLNLSLENQALGFKAKESFRSLLSQVHRFINSYSPLTSFEWTVTLVTEAGLPQPCFPPSLGWVRHP